MTLAQLFIFEKNFKFPTFPHVIDTPELLSPDSIDDAKIGVFIAITFAVLALCKIYRDLNTIHLWVFPCVVEHQGVNRIIYIDLLDQNGVYLSMLFGSVFNSLPEGYVYIQTPLGRFRGYMNSSQLDENIYLNMIALSSNRLSLRHNTTIGGAVNIINFFLLSSRYNVLIHSGFNVSRVTNYNFGELNISSYISRLMPREGVELDGLNNTRINLAVTPLFFQKNCFICG